MTGPAVIIDYGCGNPASIQNMLKKIGKTSIVSSEPAAIAEASRILFPGVGSFDYGAERIRKLGLLEALEQRVLVDGVPILGICVGHQLLARGSEEGKLPGLGWLDADVVRFDNSRMGPNDKVPNMGWCDISVHSCPEVFSGFHDEPRFYFAHAYHMKCDRNEDVAATAHHGHDYCAAIARKNIVGVQFHPEKSHRFGMKLLSNFFKFSPAVA